MSTETTNHAGRSVDEFAREVGICRATVYILEPECQPRSLKVGKRRIITESGAEWLARMAKLGGVKIKRPQAA